MEGEIHNLFAFEPYKSSGEATSDHVGEVTDMIRSGKRVIFERCSWMKAILVWEKKITPSI